MNITTQRFLKLCLCLGGVIYCHTSLAGVGGQGIKYSVQHFNAFRKLKFKNEIMVVDRGYFRSGQLVYFSRGDSSLIVDTKHSDRKYKLTKKIPGKRLVLNTIFRQGRRPIFSYRIEKDQIHYNSSSSDQVKICKSEGLDSLIGKARVGELNQLNFEDFEKLIDSKSCKLNERSRETLAEAISEQFTPGRANLVRCLSDIDSRFALSKIPDGEINAIEVLGEYLKEVEAVKKQRSQLKIKCSETEELASLKEGPPTEITLPIEDGVLSAPGKNLAHEILHLSGLDERSVNEIEGICRANFNTQDGEFKSAGTDLIQAQALTPTQTNETTISNPATPITEADFAPAPQQAVQALATAPEGSPTFKQGVTTTYNSMDRIFNHMNKIAAQIVPAANAATLAANPTAISVGKKNKIANARVSDDEVVTEHIELGANTAESANSLNLPKVNLASSTLTSSLRETQRTATPSSAEKVKPNLTERTPSRSAPRVAGSGGGSLSEGVNPGRTAGAGQKISPSREVASAGQNPNPGLGANASPSAALSPAKTLDVPSAISTLNSFSQLKGDRYQQLKALYADPAFQKKLESLKINIQVTQPSGGRAPASQGQKRNLGVNSQVAKTIFIDDGNMLRLVKRSIKGE